MKNKKDLILILSIQALSTLIILGVIYFGVMKDLPESGKQTGSQDTAAINALSARLGQVQVDLNMIKSKLGAGAPATNGR